LTARICSHEDLTVADSASRDRRRTWSTLVGALIGLAVGILVSVTTDVPLAPDAGLLLGGLAGWLWAGSARR
jgi:hypothetical protein